MTDSLISLVDIRRVSLIVCLSFVLPLSVASPGFVARRGKAVNLIAGTYCELQGQVQQLLDD